MRRAPTPAERRLWYGLRKHQLDGLKFRRQVPLGPYIADFYCPQARLVVEADGVSHIDSPNDVARDAWMREQDFRVFRVTNFDVLSKFEGILIAIGEMARGPLPLTPSRKGRGDK